MELARERGVVQGRKMRVDTQFRFRAKMNADRPDEVGRWAYDVFFVSFCPEK